MEKNRKKAGAMRIRPLALQGFQCYDMIPIPAMRRINTLISFSHYFREMGNKT